MRPKISLIRRCLLAGAVPGLLLFAGCGSSPTKPADPNAARAALQAALDAWKRGDAPDALGKAQPPIHVADWRWRSGAKLVRYELAKGDRSLGAELRCPVELWIDSGQGKTTRERTEYNVSTDPALTVARSGDR
jgi:hypothetical protein